MKAEIFYATKLRGRRRSRDQPIFFPNHNLVLKWCKTWHPFTSEDLTASTEHYTSLLLFFKEAKCRGEKIWAAYKASFTGLEQLSAK